MNAMPEITLEQALSAGTEPRKGIMDYDAQALFVLANEVRRLRSALTAQGAGEAKALAWAIFDGDRIKVLVRSEDRAKSWLATYPGLSVTPLYSHPAPSAWQQQTRVYAWLGYWRDKMPADAVSQLQDILGPLIPAPPAQQEEHPGEEVDRQSMEYAAGVLKPWKR